MPGKTGPLPSDTERAAKSIYNLNNIYLKIGDQHQSFRDRTNLDCLDSLGGTPTNMLVRLALVTSFQYVERLSDKRAVEAVRTRTDWKYALHLPLSYPGFDPWALCEFRQRLNRNEEGRVTFQDLVNSLASYGLFGLGKDQNPTIAGMLQAICSIDRLERVAELVVLTLEALAATQPHRLAKIAQPHWYTRYGQMRNPLLLPTCPEDFLGLANAIGEDIRYLIQVVQESGDEELVKLPEIQTIKRVLEDQYEHSNRQDENGDEIRWRIYKCNSTKEIPFIKGFDQ